MQKQGGIPNNIDLSRDLSVYRTLTHWQSKYLEWWREMGPVGFQAREVYLRTAISVAEGGWAQFSYVRMPEYRWGIYLSPPVVGRTISFGDHYGLPAWQEVPSDYRGMLLRLIATQGDTEPASVEQQRLLGRTAPSLYDLRNLLQVNVEEARHLWAMVYLLQRYFGSDGVRETEKLLVRRSGDSENPRLLEAFNQPIETWLDFFMFTMFTDRDGKYQLAALAESGFDPLARTCQFMLTEEAYHLFVGETGIARIIERTAALMQEGRDIEQTGGIPLGVIQRYINHWFPFCLDLFGSEVSANAAEFFGAGLKGRYKEECRHPDHCAKRSTYCLELYQEGQLVSRAVPMRQAMNEVLRDEYIRDCERAVAKWNCILERYGQTSRLRLPHRRFNRRKGLYAGHWFDLDGKWISQEEWTRSQGDLLPSTADRAYVQSLMHGVLEQGKVANWIAPPCRGIDGKPFAFEYVRL